MTDIKLPPLPPLHIVPSVEPVDYPEVAQALMDYARAAVLADRASRAAQAPAANADAWKAAVDHELTALHSTADSFANPREALRALIDWHISVERDRIADLEAELEERVAEQKTAKEYARAAVLADREAQQQDELDAARYRWLRDPCSGAERVIFYCRGDYGRGLMSGSMLDAAIDAAMQRIRDGGAA